MIKASFVVLCVWVFLFDSIKYGVDGKHHKPQELMVRISFHANDPDHSRKFFNEQLAPAFEDLTKCISWAFDPIITPQPDNPYTTVDEYYGCANKPVYSGYNRGKFYICMMSKEEDYFKVSECATSSGLDWSNDLMFCNPLNLVSHPLPMPMMIMLCTDGRSESTSEGITDFKNAICKKLKELKKECGCCPS